MASKNEVAQATPMDMAINNKFIDQLGTQLRDKEKLGLSFPKSYSVENALNAAYLMLQETKDKSNVPVLQSCSKQSIASSLMDMAVQALNPIKKQCYFVAYGGKLTLMRSYQGTKAVAKRCGVKKICSQVIYDGDVFLYRIEDGIKVLDKHEQDFMNVDNEKIKGAYSILTLEDGSTHMEVMNINQIKKAWSKGYGYKSSAKEGTVHTDFADQMALKTVEARACKNFINSSDDSDLLDAFNDTSENEYIDQAEVEMEHDVQENANSIDFDEEVEETEVIETVELDGKVVAETVAKGVDKAFKEVASNKSNKGRVPKPVETEEVPDFMK